MRKLLLAFFILISCEPLTDLQESPSGRFMAFFTIWPGEQGYDVWVVNIRSKGTESELTLPMQDYPASLMAYMSWEEDEDRLWLYSSDDGKYFYWELTDKEWQTGAWSIIESTPLCPPQSLEEQRDRNRRD